MSRVADQNRSKIEANMARWTSILKYVQIVVAGCIVAAGIVIVGIGSHLIAYTDKHRHSVLPVCRILATV